MNVSIPATKQDVEEIVGRVVGEIVGDALQMISDRFDKTDKCMGKRFDGIDQRLGRVEDKLDANIATVDHHTIDIRELQRKAP